MREFFSVREAAATRLPGLRESQATGATVFQAGTRFERGNCGRVLGVTAGGATLQQTVGNAYRGMAEIRFEGIHYRKDIGSGGGENNLAYLLLR